METTFEWDENKNQINIEKHGFDFRDAVDFFDGPNYTMEDNRRDYGEKRLVSIGFLKERMVVLIYTIRENTIRIISMRKANEREQKRFKDRLGPD